MYQRIFVPIDDSKTSLYALEQTCRLAKATDAVLVAVHVVDLTDLKREASRLPNAEELYAAEMQVADHAEAVMDEGSRTQPGRFVKATLRPQVTITQAQHVEQAKALHHEAHRLCFIANSLNFEVECECEIVVK